MKAVRENLEVWAARLLIWVFSILPEAAAMKLGSSLGWLFWVLDRRHRRVAKENLVRAFPNQSSEDLDALVTRVYKNLGLSLAEWGQNLSRSGDSLLASVTFDGLEHAEEGLADGRGVLIVVGHLGNWEMTGAVVAARFPGTVTVAAQAQSNRRFDRFINTLRNRAGMEVILSESGASRRMIDALGQNKILGILADQNAGPKGLMINFFGRPCSVLRSPVILARRAGSRMVCSVLIRKPGGGFILRMSPPVDLGGTVFEATARWLQVFENWVREDPSQWFWVHRRWKEDPLEKTKEGVGT